MAKKEITANSSPSEIRLANEQLAKAQQEYKAALVPFKGKSLSLIEQDKIAKSVASRYDYVDFGTDPALVTPGEINIGGTSTFYVKGLSGQSQTNFPPETNTTVNTDDAFPVTRPNTGPTQQPNSQGQNPNQPKTDQQIVNETNPSNATDAPAVQPDNRPNTTSNNNLTQAGEALDAKNKAQSTQAQQGVIGQNGNQLPTTNNLPGRLSDEFVRERINTDDSGRRQSPMGTSFTGTGELNLVDASPDAGRLNNTNQVSIDTAESSKIPPKTPGTNNKAGVEVRPNMLHEFANWTYKIAWYMLKNQTYNSIIKSGTISDFSGAELIARSGGAGSELNVAIGGDLYFRNLRFTSVIGNRQSSAATNNIELEMTVVEPYGASLIGELAAMAVNLTGQNSISPSEVAYLLEIDFAGYKDDGTPVPSILSIKSGGKKYIPVKILSIDMTLESAGAVYTIGMAPYSYFAQTPRYAETEFGVTLEGNTVTDLLGLEGGLMQYLNGFESLKVAQKLITIPDEYNIDIISFTPNGSSDQSMANSLIAFPQTGGNATIMKTRPPDSNNPQISSYTISKGSIIKDVIKNIILASQYYNEKVKPKNPNDESAPAELIKIIPVIEITDKFDKARNEFAKRITYKVFNTLLYGEVNPYVGNAPVSNWGYGKEYNWLFTGKNEDVIDANLAFNMIYYTKMQTNITDYNNIKLSTSADSERIEASTADKSKLGMAIKSGSVSNSGSNVPQRYINAAIAAEWFDSKMASSNADNVTLDLRIIGDPDWIPQDSSIRGGNISVGTNLFDKHQSVAVDVAGVYVKLNLRTPRDYNSKTGLMDIKNDQLTIQGIYQVITVESTFEDGRFTQTLNMVKVPNQEEEKPKNSSAGLFDSNNPADRQLRGDTVRQQSFNPTLSANPTLIDPATLIDNGR